MSRALMQALKKNDDLLSAAVRRNKGMFLAMRNDLSQFILQHQKSDGKMAQAASSMKFLESTVKEFITPMGEVRRVLDEAGQNAIEAFQGVDGAESLLQATRTEIATTIDANFDDIAKNMIGVNKNLARALKQEIAVMTLVPKSTETAARVIAEVADRSLAQAETLINTGMASVQRDLHAQALRSIPEDEAMVLYLGPDDGKTRGFCAVLAGLAIKKADIAKLKNGQRGASNVLRHGGGWNCRHRLLPITADFAEARRLRIATRSDILKANSAARR